MSVRGFASALLAGLLAGLLVGACSGGSPAGGSSSVAGSVAAPAELQVYAAASLKPALAAVKSAYEAAHPGIALTVSTDSSTALEAKIEQGAPADVFLSADMRNPQTLVDHGFAAGPVTAFAGNRLAIIVPPANPAGIGAPPDLARPGVKLIAAADGVPIQRYTAQWLAKVAALPGFGPDFAARYNANVVSREDNVGAVVAKVALGEGDAGVAYASDAATAPGVKTIAIPSDQNVPAEYGGAVVQRSLHRDAAAAFLAWLAGPGGQAILATFGFQPPG